MSTHFIAAYVGHIVTNVGQRAQRNGLFHHRR